MQTGYNQSTSHRKLIRILVTKEASAFLEFIKNKEFDLE